MAPMHSESGFGRLGRVQRNSSHVRVLKGIGMGLQPALGVGRRFIQSGLGSVEPLAGWAKLAGLEIVEGWGWPVTINTCGSMT